MSSNANNCSSCNLRELCLPVGLSAKELEQLDALVTTRKRIARGASLFRSGDPFTALYAVRTGFFKTELNTSDGRGQVTGFQMSGELMGLDGIVQDHHNCDAVALEDSEVCVMAFERIEALCREFDVLQRHLHKVMSREIVRDQGVMMLLGIMNAEERIASFLANLVDRHKARGFSSSEIVLRMSRRDIGSYLGMTIETVSRVFSKLSQDGIVEVNQKHIRICDPVQLIERAHSIHASSDKAPA
jgi:CRP/FNR family transcriptional regulator